MSEQHLEGSPSPKISSFWEKHTLIITFFVAVILSISVYGLAAYFQHKRFVKSQDRIVSIFRRQVTHPTNNTVQVSNSVLQQLEKQDQFHQEIKSLLDLEFDRIQNEFESFEIWAGIITIIFLIFSFYSLFKTEQFERQGRETLEFIRKAEDEVAVKIKGIETDKATELAKISGDFKGWKEEKEKDIATAIRHIGNETKEGIIAKYEQIFKESLANLEKGYVEKSEAKIKELSETSSDVMKNQFGEYSKQFNELIDELKKRASTFSHLDAYAEDDIEEPFKESDQVEPEPPSEPE